MQHHSYFTDAVAFMEGFKTADKHGLRYEFVAAFFDFLKADNEAIKTAVSEALREWDL